MMVLDGEERPIVFEYTFLVDEDLKAFALELDDQTLALNRAPTDELPEWTELGRRQYEICPLTPETHPNCPMP